MGVEVGREGDRERMGEGKEGRYEEVSRGRDTLLCVK